MNDNKFSKKTEEESDVILQMAFNSLLSSLDGEPDGDVIFKYQGAHKVLNFASLKESDLIRVKEGDFSNFIFLCEKLQETMYSPKTGAWLSFTLMLTHDRRFNAVFDFDSYPTDLDGEPLSLAPVRELFEHYPRRDLPEWYF